MWESVDVVWNQALDRLQVAVEVDLALLEDAGHVLLCFHLVFFDFVVKLCLCLGVLHLVDARLVEEALRPRDQHPVVEDLQVSDHHVNIVALHEDGLVRRRVDPLDVLVGQLEHQEILLAHL